jgi:Transposase DDE domain
VASSSIVKRSPPTLQDKDIVCLGHLRRVFPLLDRLNDVGCQRDKAGNRQLFFGDYCKLVLLYVWNPLIDSLRQLQAATELRTVAKALGVKRFSLGSFSEAPRIFEPQSLQPIIAELAGELSPIGKDPRLAELKHALTLVDGTLVAALARLAKAAVGDEARYNTSRDGRAVYAWRLHTQLDLETFSPRRIDRTGARNAGDNRENNVLRRNLEADRCYVGDGGYADRSLFDDVVAAASSYVIRLARDAVFEVAQDGDGGGGGERLLSQEALDAGVVRDAVLARLGVAGATAMNHPVRLVAVQVEPHPRRTRKGTEHCDLILIATNLLDLPAELIALIYLYRYTVELFFRVFKQLLGMRHLLSQRPNGIDIQTHCTLIVGLLICLMSGRRPDKTTRNMIGWHLIGLASEQELIDHLNRPDNTGIKKRAKDELWKKMGW